MVQQIKANPDKTRTKMLKVWGIGPETADSILLYAFDYPVFVVDSYTKRLVKKFWPKQKLDYQALQNFFEKNLPKKRKLYQEFHALIVRWGKENGGC